jgi:pimeloyl-ACP methyl ester carboxylesterase
LDRRSTGRPNPSCTYEDRRLAREGPWTLLGNQGCACHGLEIPGGGFRLGFGVRLLLPDRRADVLLLSGPAVPVIGDVIRYTVSPILSRLLWPSLLRKIFGPALVPDKFKGFPKEMTFRPSQIRASAAETALMIPSAFALRGEYASLKMPVFIIAGEEDRIVDIERQSARLHRDIKQSKFRRVANTGHMVHQTAPAQVMAAIEDAGQTAAMTGRAKEGSSAA